MVNNTPPKRNPLEYLAMLQALLPLGLAWSRSPEGNLTKALHASAEELARLDASAHLLVEEVNPTTTNNALDDWERVLALPDACLPAGTTFQERKDAVLAKLNDIGRQDLAYWYELAASLGYEVTIEEHWPFCCGIHECADFSGCDEMAEQAAYPMARLGNEEIRYWLNVIVHGDSLILFRCGESECGELLMDWRGAETLECLMRRDMEAHVVLTFKYEEGVRP